MRKTIFYALIMLLALFGAGCTRERGDQDQTRIKAEETPVQNIANTDSGHACEDASVPMRDDVVGEIVQWQGVFCGLSQIDGIKLCFWDDKLGANAVDVCNWFWAIPEVAPSIDEYNGKWVEWMLNKYGDIDSDELSGDEVFLVSGKYISNDCGFYDDSGICVSNVEVERIEVKQD